MLTPNRTLLSAALILALGAVAPLAVSAPAAAVATGTCAQREQPNQQNAQPIRSNYQDIQGDDQVADPAVGVPAYGSGVVDLVLSSTAGHQRVTEGTFTGLPPATSGDRFGAAVGYLDLDADVCHDLAVGAPETDSGTGSVVLATGGPSGIQAAGAIRLTGKTRGEHFGAAVATFESNRIGTTTVFIGAPDRTVNGKARAGAIDAYTVDQTVTGAARVAYAGTITQDSPGVGGTAEAGDRFGSVLAQGQFDDLVVGDPDEAVGTRTGAGAVTVLRRPRDAAMSSDVLTFVGGTAAGDRFGAALAVTSGNVWDSGGENTLALGAPGRRVGTHGGAGAVELFSTGVQESRYVRTVTQDSLRVPGVAESGDHFGASVQIGLVASCDSDRGMDLAIGSPGEDVGSVRDAGSMTVTSAGSYIRDGYDVGVASYCQFPYSQGSGHNIADLFGSLETGDSTGATVGLIAGTCEYGRLGDKRCGFDEVQVASPGEDVGAVVDAGGVTIVDIARAPDISRSHGYSGGRYANQRYGSVAGYSSASIGT